ncbi:hypothetical protein A5893_10780 [Pedobacter psychrophilus]|uniref:Uncharacterized protein n=1 Tax=Pedobacter psychrophilus TaxID=1826909 RepID=A0A179DEA1_9SPHI|nr:hypothetical protein [Pedobacter psychrophilus]OAQ39142.1 hypothetical protein A5893_10780 [Pedobacter psychrophilus]
MDISAFFVDVLKYTLSGLFVFFAAYFLLKNHFDTYYDLKELEYKKMVVKDILPLKLQAYERMILFVERINPTNLMVRLHQSGMTAKEMQGLVINEVKAEYQHNISQQLYISQNAWNIIKRVKDDTIGLINHSANILPAETSAVELSKLVFIKMEELEENPYDLALLVMKNDIQEI